MEYSAKYRVSISTLRRKIKAGEMDSQLIDGKYLVKDKPYKDQHTLSSGTEVVAPPSPTQPQNQRPQEFREILQTPLTLVAKPQNVLPLTPATQVAPSGAVQEKETISATVEKLLAEIKKAYSLILQEKEEQILQLRSEVTDLKTLVRVLEEQSPNTTSTISDKFDLDLDL